MDFKFEIDRFSMTPFYTLGRFLLTRKELPALSGYTLELPWKENRSGISCIPHGRYEVVWNKSKKFGDRYSKLMPLVASVPKREGVRIHPGNRTSEITGCILIGSHSVIHSPTVANVYGSRKVYDKLVEIVCPNEMHLIITESR